MALQLQQVGKNDTSENLQNLCITRISFISIRYKWSMPIMQFSVPFQTHPKEIGP
jgi:hypothetical protein